MKHMQKKSTSILGALSQPGATLDADSSWAMAVALCSAVETLIDLQLRISRLCIPHAQERLACVLRRRSARRSAVGADESRGSAALVRSCHPRVVRERLGGARPSCLEDQSLISARSPGRSTPWTNQPSSQHPSSKLGSTCMRRSCLKLWMAASVMPDTHGGDGLSASACVNVKR